MNTQTTQPQIKTLAELMNDLSAAESKFKNGGYKDEDFKDLKIIQASIKKFEDEKQVNIKAITDKIKGFGFTLTDIFTSDEIKEAGFIVKPKNPSGSTTAKSATVKPSDSNQVLIHIPVEAGEHQTAKPLDYKKGRINDAYNDKIKKAWNESTLPTKLARNSTEDALKKYFTDAGKTYFATPEGKAELTKLVELLKVLAPKKLALIKKAQEKADKAKALA